MRAILFGVSLAILGGLCTSVPIQAVIYLDAGFDDKTVGEPIGTGGPDVGEPVSVSSCVTAIVRGDPMPTPFLEIADNDDYAAGSARFELLGGVEITTGVVVVTANLWFPAYENFFIYVREQGSSASVFTNLYFGADGLVTCRDANSYNGVIGTYDTGRHFPVQITYSMDYGMYFVWLDGVLVLAYEEHGVVGDGVGAVLFGCTHDADYDGRMFVDDVFVDDFGGPDYHLRANFNYKTIDAPIGTGGPEIGEPIRVDTMIMAVVRDTPMFTPALEITDDDDYAAGYALFEFMRDAEVTSGVVVVGAHLWFDLLEDYKVIVREHGSAAQTFTNLNFTSAGMVYIVDAGGSVGYEYYETGRVYAIMLVYNMDTGTYDVWLDGVLVVDDEPHGISGRGVGSVGFGCAHDADYDGRFYVDNIWVSNATTPFARVCCVETTCHLAIAMDCAYNVGEFHEDLGYCEPNPCVGSSVDDQTGGREVLRLSVSPNPFHERTVLRYSLRHAEWVRVHIHDLSGRCVRALFSGYGAVGSTTISWDGLDDAGQRVPAGVYFGHLASESGAVSRSVIVLE
jgi:hypothetical protein